MKRKKESKLKKEGNKNMKEKKKETERTNLIQQMKRKESYIDEMRKKLIFDVMFLRL